MPRLRHQAAAAGIAALAALAPPAAGQSPDPRGALASIAPEVMFLRATGSWTRGDREGTTRMVILRSGSPDGAQRLFVQWLGPADRAGGRAAVVATEEVPEVFDWRIGIEDYRVEPEAGGSRVLLDGRIIGSGQARRYMLTIGPPGEITFSSLR